MKTTKKALLTVLCALLLVVASVMGTMAYLTKTVSVVNTFTVGNVDITMDEADVSEYGEKLNAEGAVADEGDTLANRVPTNEYKLIPGKTYTKDPTVYVSAGSEDAWIFVMIDNGISALTGDSITTQLATGWTKFTGAEGEYYGYNTKLAAGESVTVFNTFTIDDEADVSAVKAEDVIEIIACAVQADGLTLEDASEAVVWTVAP